MEKEGQRSEGGKKGRGREGEKKNVLASGPGIYFDRETGTKRDDIPSEFPMTIRLPFLRPIRRMQWVQLRKHDDASSTEPADPLVEAAWSPRALQSLKRCFQV